MFRQQTNLPQIPTIKVYLRLKDKNSFVLSLKEPIFLGQLKEHIFKKTKISEHDLIVMYQGKQINFSHNSDTISLKDRSILHIINKKNLRNDIIQISVKFILRNDEKACLGQTKLFAKSQESIKNFIHSKVLRVIEERTDQKICEEDLNLVLNGMILKKNMHFHNFLIEDGSQIVCMINNSESLQKFVHNISTHKILTLHHQKLNEEIKTKEKIPIDSKKFPEKLHNQRKISEIQNQSNKPFSQKKSEEFVKLQTFESKIELEEKQRLLNEALQHKGNKKLKKKQKIRSDLARKIQHELEAEKQKKNIDFQKIENDNEENLLEDLPEPEMYFQHQQKSEQQKQKHPNKENQESKNKDFPQNQSLQLSNESNLFTKVKLDVSGAENKNLTKRQSEQPDSPIEVQYPPIQKRGHSLVQWDSRTVSNSLQEEFDRHASQEKTPLLSKQNTGSQRESSHLTKIPQPQEAQKSCFVQKNDLLMYGSLHDDQIQTHSIKDLSYKFTGLLKQKYLESSQSEYLQPQKRQNIKIGDFLIYNSMQNTSDRFISQMLVHKFGEFIRNINKKVAQDYDIEKDKQQKTEGNPKVLNSQSKSEETLNDQSKLKNI